MAELELTVVSLRYSSWSMRAWLALRHAGAEFVTRTADLHDVQAQVRRADGAIEAVVPDLATRRRQGSITGLFPVLRVDGVPVHEALAICEWVAETYPAAGLWPDQALDRARARSVSCEMASGFPNIRATLSCHPFARVPGFVPTPEARREIDRVFEIWRELLDRHGGPFLTGRFGVPDCMYYPMLTRFRTYGVALPADLESYGQAMEACPAVQAVVAEGRHGPRVPVYDDYVRGLGGDPDAALPAAP